MSGTLTVADMQANVARSEGHVAKQDVIIIRLAEQGHEVMLAKAKAILVTMHSHLAIERDVLARMEAEAAP